MPAVSTKRHMRPPSSTTSSTGSRVVPASSLTTTRSSPAALFSSEDLPTFGRPRIATRRGPPISCLATAEMSGSTFMTSSRRSATPRPWMAETGYGSPRPRLHRAAASGSCRASSILFATRKTGRPVLRSILTTCSSVEVGPDHGIHDEQHDVAQVDRDLGLRRDRRVDAAGVGLPAAGVDHGEAAVHPLGLVGDAVARDAGGVFDDGLAAAEDPVHERGLADVRASDDRDDRQGGKELDAVLAELDAREQRRVFVFELVVGERRAQRGRPLLGELLVEVCELLDEVVRAAFVLFVSVHDVALFRASPGP